MLDDQGSISGRATKSSLLHRVQIASGVHTASYPMGTGDSFPGVKRPGKQADHSPAFSAEIKNGGAIPSLPVRLHGVALEHTDNFSLPYGDEGNLLSGNIKFMKRNFIEC
jgi:hypothetical protein